MWILRGENAADPSVQNVQRDWEIAPHATPDCHLDIALEGNSILFWNFLTAKRGRSVCSIKWANVIIDGIIIQMFDMFNKEEMINE